MSVSNTNAISGGHLQFSRGFHSLAERAVGVAVAFLICVQLSAVNNTQCLSQQLCKLQLEKRKA